MKMNNARRNDKPGIAVAVAAIGTIGTIIVAVIQSGVLMRPTSASLGITATTPIASASNMNVSAASQTSSTVSFTLPEPKPLSNEVRDHVGSVKVEFGCAILYGSPKDDSDQLRFCDNMPNMGVPWNTHARRMTVDCSSASKDRILVLVWSEPNYAGYRWEYGFGC
jgi:hypothetical protein